MYVILQFHRYGGVEFKGCQPSSCHTPAARVWFLRVLFLIDLFMSKRILATILQWFYLTLACQSLLRALKPLSACILWQVHIILLLHLNKQTIYNYVRLFFVCRAGQWRQIHSHTAGGDDARDCFRHGLSSRHGICTQGEYRLCLVRWMSFIDESVLVCCLWWVSVRIAPLSTEYR